MNNDKWLYLVDQIKDKFGIVSRETEDVTAVEKDGTEKKIGTIEKIIFENELGKMMITRKTTPLVVGREERYHKKRGTAATSLIYSPTESVYHIAVYKWNASKGIWEEITLRGTFTV